MANLPARPSTKLSTTTEQFSSDGMQTEFETETEPNLSTTQQKWKIYKNSRKRRLTRDADLGSDTD